MIRFAMCFAVLALLSGGLFAQDDSITEPSTEKHFPISMTFSHDGADYSVTASGTAVRKKFFVKVYGMAHYMAQGPFENADAAIAAVMADGSPKQIIMDFARDVGGDKIQGAYMESFEKNLSEAQMAELKPQIDQFLGYFANEVKENEQYILRWLPGGVIVSIVGGEEKPAVTSVPMAQALWSAWFGEGGVVDAEDLVKRAVKK